MVVAVRAVVRAEEATMAVAALGMGKAAAVSAVATAGAVRAAAARAVSRGET